VRLHLSDFSSCHSENNQGARFEISFQITPFKARANLLDLTLSQAERCFAKAVEAFHNGTFVLRVNDRLNCIQASLDFSSPSKK